MLRIIFPLFRTGRSHYNFGGYKTVLCRYYPHRYIKSGYIPHRIRRFTVHLPPSVDSKSDSQLKADCHLACKSRRGSPTLPRRPPQKRRTFHMNQLFALTRETGVSFGRYFCQLGFQVSATGNVRFNVFFQGAASTAVKRRTGIVRHRMGEICIC